MLVVALSACAGGGEESDETAADSVPLTTSAVDTTAASTVPSVVGDLVVAMSPVWGGEMGTTGFVEPDAACVDVAFADLQSRLSITYFYPGPETWPAGDRLVHCIAFGTDVDEQFVGSLAGLAE